MSEKQKKRQRHFPQRNYAVKVGRICIDDIAQMLTDLRRSECCILGALSYLSVSSKAKSADGKVWELVAQAVLHEYRPIPILHYTSHLPLRLSSRVLVSWLQARPILNGSTRSQH